MTRRQKDSLRPLTDGERTDLERLSRSEGAPAAPVARGRALLAVAAGCSYQAAARAAGRRDGDAVTALVARFNREGLAAVEPRHGGGPPLQYTAVDRARILDEVHRLPDRARDGTATWSLTTLQRSLRRAADGFPRISTYTLWWVLHAADLHWQRDRSWCHTGCSVRRRQQGGQITEVTVYDPDASVKKA